MKNLFFLSTLLLLANTTSISAKEYSENARHYIVSEHAYTFSKAFHFDGQDPGIVTKKHYVYGNLRTHYDSYDRDGMYEAQGISRLFCLGTLFSWATEIDIYDADGKKIGMIDGQVATLCPARFSIYEYNPQSGKSKLVGIAYMDNRKTNLIICDPKKETRELATIRRHEILGAKDDWECIVFDKNVLDLRIIKIFMAFAVDHQEYFRADN